MRIVRPICCGADIHKDLIAATIATTIQDGITEYIQSSFSFKESDKLIIYDTMDRNCRCYNKKRALE